MGLNNDNAKKSKSPFVDKDTFNVNDYKNGGFEDDEGDDDIDDYEVNDDLNIELE